MIAISSLRADEKIISQGVDSMGESYSVAVPSMEKVFSLGKQSSAKYTLPLLMENVVFNDLFIFYYDGGHCEDRYEYELEYEQVSYDYIPKEFIDTAETICMSNVEFSRFYEKYIGKETTWDAVKQLLSKT